MKKKQSKNADKTTQKSPNSEHLRMIDATKYVSRD